MVHRHYLVSGRVQGVGFRNFVYRRALALDLEGRVRNLFDGRVEVIARGAEDKMKQFETEIGRGPQLAEVTDVKVVTISDSSSILRGLREFTVVSDGEEPWSIVG